MCVLCILCYFLYIFEKIHIGAYFLHDNLSLIICGMTLNNKCYIISPKPTFQYFYTLCGNIFSQVENHPDLGVL